MPAFFAVIGLAAAVILPALWRALDRTVDRLGGRWLPAAARTAVVVGVLAGSALFAAMGNRAFAYTMAMMTTDDGDWPFDRLYRGEPDWEAAVPALAPVVDESAIVLASAAPKALYYLDRVDGHVAATELVGRFGRAPEFSRDTTALGRPAISTPESVAEVLRRCPSGLIIAEERHWKKSWAIPDDTAAFIAGHAEPIDLPERSKLVAYRWGAGTGAAPCELPVVYRESSASAP
jgi:hypothetical protein